MDAVEEERRERELARPVAFERRAEPAHRDLERVRAAVLPECDHLAVEHDGFQRETEHRLDDLRDALGHLGEAARVGAHLVAPPVHLDARPVELPFDHRGLDAPERLGDADRRLREHRLHGAEELEPEPGEAGRALGEGGVRHLVQAARQHRRATHVGRRHAGRFRNRLDHDALERALTEPAVEQRPEEVLLRLRRTPEELVELLLARPLRPGARRGAEAVERGGNLEQLESRLLGRRRKLPERRPADARPRDRAGEERHGDRDLCRPERSEAGGQQLDLRRARARLRDGGRDASELRKLHAGDCSSALPVGSDDAAARSRSRHEPPRRPRRRGGHRPAGAQPPSPPAAEGGVGARVRRRARGLGAGRDGAARRQPRGGADRRRERAPSDGRGHRGGRVARAPDRLALLARARPDARRDSRRSSAISSPSAPSTPRCGC